MSPGFMKKYLFFILLFLISCTLPLNAQVTLFKGIRSGLNQNGLYRFLYNNLDFTFHKGAGGIYYTTSIYGKDYSLRAGYNIYGELYVVDFISDLCYESVYSPALEGNLKEVLSMMTGRYGKPGYDGWNDLSELSDNSEKIIYLFGRGREAAAIKLEKNDDGTCSVVVAFEDVALEEITDETQAGSDSSIICDDSDDSGEGF
jgi:hypothetical protein